MDEQRKRVILVEGPDDFHFLANFLGTMDAFKKAKPSTTHGFDCSFAPIEGLPPNKDLHIKATGGVSKLRKAIKPQLEEATLDTLAIIVDADDPPDENMEGNDTSGGSAKPRWQQIVNQIAKVAGTNWQPPELSPSGAAFDITVAGNRVRIGIWIMPDNASHGMLESFFEQLIPESDPVLPKSLEYIEFVKQIDEGTRFKNTHEAKARVDAWLAVQNPPGYPMGRTVKQRNDLLSLNSELAVAFRDWLNKMIFE